MAEGQRDALVSRNSVTTKHPFKNYIPGPIVWHYLQTDGQTHDDGMYRMSVTLRYCIKTAKRRITQIMPHDRPGTLVF